MNARFLFTCVASLTIQLSTSAADPVGCTNDSSISSWLDGCGECAGLFEGCNAEEDDWKGRVGGASRFRFIDERNRLRPPVPAGRSTYNQYRFTPFAELTYSKNLQLYVQAIEAQTFNADLPELQIDENRADLLQFYADVKLADSDSKGALRLRVGRQMLSYGSQHLISPLAWANTFRNFEGFRLYYDDKDFSVDAFAVQPVNGASGNLNRPTSYDTPDQSRWFSGIYAVNKNAPGGTLDLYWLWLNERADAPNLIDGNRHTFGTRYAGKKKLSDKGSPSVTGTWDLEGALQFGQEDFLTGLNQNIRAGFISLNAGVSLDDVTWKPALAGIFYYGSGDRNPVNGTNNTFSTLFPLGHAYWGQIDNFNGSNLIDYGLHLTVKPTEKLTFLTGTHWFTKASRQDAIYNIAGVPFGGAVPTAGGNLGTELDLVATYQLRKDLQLQAGYFWFWYGNAVNGHPVPAVANRSDAHMFYSFIDWTF
ncbi:MAG: alginate export family protein [Planctomycetaceae bacterium]